MAAVVLVTIAGILVLTLGGGDRREPSAELTPNPSFTPSDVATAAPLPNPSYEVGATATG